MSKRGTPNGLFLASKEEKEQIIINKKQIMKITKLLIIATLCFSFWNCQQQSESQANEGYSLDLEQSVEMDFKTTPESEEQQGESNEIGETEPTKIERKLIRNARLGFQSDDLEKTEIRLNKLTKQLEGYVSNDESNNNYGEFRHSLTVRIPSKNFDAFLKGVGEGVDEFDYKNISTNDVTAEYLDVESRIKTKKELETRYLEILNKANSVTEMLEIERELNNVRGEIESAQGRLKYLKNQVSYSTFYIEYYKEVPYQGDSFAERMGEGFGNGWNNLLMFFVGIVNLWPFLILIIVAVWGFRKWRRS